MVFTVSEHPLQFLKKRSPCGPQLRYAGWNAWEKSCPAEGCILIAWLGLTFSSSSNSHIKSDKWLCPIHEESLSRIVHIKQNLARIHTPQIRDFWNLQITSLLPVTLPEQWDFSRAPSTLAFTKVSICLSPGCLRLVSQPKRTVILWFIVQKRDGLLHCRHCNDSAYMCTIKQKNKARHRMCRISTCKKGHFPHHNKS